MQERAPSPVGLRLQQARKLIDDLSARELDRLAGTTPGHASLIESGVVSNVKLETATGLARVLGMSLDWFVNGTGDAPTAESVRAAVAAARIAKASDSTRDLGAAESGEHPAQPSPRTASG